MNLTQDALNILAKYKDDLADNNVSNLLKDLFDDKSKNYLYDFTSAVYIRNALLEVIPAKELIENCSKIYESLFYAVKFDPSSIDLKLPSSVTKIETNAFRESNLHSIEFSDKITVIGKAAFYSCTDLDSELKLPKSCVSISMNAFDRSAISGNLDMPDKLKVVNKYAFADCTNLTSLTFGSSIEQIKQQAFYNCSGLTKIDLSKATKLKYIDAFAFALVDGANISRNAMSVYLPDHFNSKLLATKVDRIFLRRDFEIITFYCHKNSEAENFCKIYKLKYKLY